MSFKPVESPRLVLKKGKVEDSFCFKVRVQTILVPTVAERPVKCLGNWFDSSPIDTGNIRNSLEQVEDWMQKVE